MTTKTVKADARNRASRSVLQGLGIDVAVSVALVVYDALSTEKPDYRLLGVLVIKTALQTVAAYVMRLKVAPAPRD